MPAHSLYVAGRGQVADELKGRSESLLHFSERHFERTPQDGGAPAGEYVHAVSEPHLTDDR